MDGIRSGLVCVIDLGDPALESLRQAHDPHAALGVPAHVTCVFPFAPPSVIDSATTDALRDLVAGFDSFEVVFPDVGEFPGVVWLRPEPEEPFRALTRAIVAAFPEYPPYEGAYDDPQPHLTIGMDLDRQATEVLRARVAAEITARPPRRAHVSSLSLLARDVDGSWREERRFALRPR